MALYTLLSDNDLANYRFGPSQDQTRVYDILSRNGYNVNQPNDDNFFVRRGKSIENALGTTGAAIAAFGNDLAENYNINERNNRFNQSLQDIYKQAGYNSVDDYYNAKEAAEKDAFGRIGFNIDDYWDKRADADIAGNKDEIARLDSEYNAAKARIGNDEALAKFNDIQNRLQAQTAKNQQEATDAARKYADYRKNDYISQKINQDQGKFLGSAINTLSTAFDVMAPGAGVLANSLQGGIEGVADELEQNGFKNFDWGRAGQNALIGATTGAVTGKLNQGISTQLAKNGGNLFKGGNFATQALNDLGSKTALGRVGSTLATGAARGAVSGAAGGAVGGGLSAAMNGGDVIGSALQGAQRGAGQGAFAGGTMAGANMAASRIPGISNAMRSFREAGDDWEARKANGESFGERLKNTWEESPTRDYMMSNKKGFVQLPFSENRAPRTQAETDIINAREQNMDAIRRMVDLDDGAYFSKNDLERNPQVSRLISEGKLVEVKDREGWDGIANEPMPTYKINEDALWSDKDISDMARFYNDEEYGSVDEAGTYNPEQPIVLDDRANMSPSQTSLFDNNAQLQGQASRFNAPEDWAGNQKTLTAEADKILNTFADRLINDIPARRGVDSQGKVSLNYGETISGRNEAIANLRARFSDNDLAFLFTKANTPKTRAIIHDSIDSPEIKNRLADWAGENPIQAETMAAEQPTTQATAPVRTTDGYTAQDLIDMATKQKDQFVDDVRAITAENNGIPNEAFFDTAVKSNVNRIAQNAQKVNTPETEVYRALTKEQQATPRVAVDQAENTLKTSKSEQLRYKAAQELLKQYGTIDKPTAKATNAPKTIQEIANAGFTKPGDVERIADNITGSNGEVNKLVQNLILNAKPVNTFDGVNGKTMEQFIDDSINRHALDGISEGKAVKSQINAYLASLESRRNGSLNYMDNPEDVMDVVRGLEAEAANYEGRSGMNYGTTTQDKMNAAKVAKDVATLLKDRLFDTVNVKSALTPDVAESLKALAPKNEQWADYVDNNIMTARNVQDLRRVQAPFVRAKKIIDNGYLNSMTYGGRVGNAAASSVPTTKAGVIKTLVNDTLNTNFANRLKAGALNKAADLTQRIESGAEGKAGGNQPAPTTAAALPSGETSNPSTRIYDAIGRTEGLTNAEQARTADYLVSAAQAPQNANTGATGLENLYTGTTNNPSTSVYNSISGNNAQLTNNMSTKSNNRYFQRTGDYWTDLIGDALALAIDADDVAAFSSLYKMYQQQMAGLEEKQAKASGSGQKLTATQQRANAAMNSLNRLSQMNPDLGYNLSGIPIIGGIATLGGNDYEGEAKSLAQQIGYMVSGANIKEEEAFNIGKAYVPQPFDSEQTRKLKLQRAYDIIRQYQNGTAEEV